MQTLERVGWAHAGFCSEIRLPNHVILNQRTNNGEEHVGWTLLAMDVDPGGQKSFLCFNHGSWNGTYLYLSIE